MSAATDRLIRKAEAACEAWQRLFPMPPSRDAVVAMLCVAEHETLCGDAKGWEGEHNWGACQRPDGRLTKEEQATLKANGIVAAPPWVKGADGRPAEQRARDFIGRPGGAIHVDSSPTATGPAWYFVYFYAFDSDVDGAELFIRVLAVQRSGCRAVLTNAPKNVDALAEQMYRSRYFEGRHPPKLQPGESVDAGGLTPGQRRNIADYAGALRRLQPGIAAALATWTPPTTGEAMDAMNQEQSKEHTQAKVNVSIEVIGVQYALTRLGYSPGPIDGLAGPMTKKAVTEFQKRRGIEPADGEISDQVFETLALDISHKK